MLVHATTLRAAAAACDDADGAARAAGTHNAPMEPCQLGSQWGPGTILPRHDWVGDATIPYVRPDMPGWKWELENVLPFMHDPFIAHTQLLSDPTDHVAAVSVGR